MNQIILTLQQTVVSFSASDDLLQLQLAEEAKLAQQVALTTLLPFVLAFSFFFFIFYRQRRELNIQREKTELEMRALRSQMNPHFIFNSLNSIYLFIKNNETTEAASYLLKFSHLMRRVLEHSVYEVVSLADDLETLSLYIELEKLRSGFRFNYTLHCPLSEADELYVPPLILQPIVENAIWHGMSMQENGQLHISIEKTNEQLKCSVVNTISKAPSQTNDLPNVRKIPALGSTITSDRLKLLNHKYKGSARIVADQKDENKMNVVIFLPIIKD